MPHLIKDQIDELIDLMEDDFQDLVHTYVEDSEEKFPLLLTAIQAESCTDVAEVSHSLKGSSANICAADLSNILKKIETQARDENLSDALELFKDALHEFKSVKSQLIAL